MPQPTTRLPPASAFLFLALMLCAGCGAKGPEQPWREYLTRLGRTLDVPVPPLAATPVPAPPRPGQIRVELAPGSLDSLDFLAISGCAVQVTIGKRNSSLGQLAPPSQRLLLELEYLRLAPECIDYQRQRGKEELANTLEDAWQLKQGQLAPLIYNATLAGPEYRQFWRAAREPGGFPKLAGSQVLQALQGINAMARRWLAGDYGADNRAFETLLGEVAGGDGGELLAALAKQGDYLQAADTMLAASQARGPLCGPGIRRDAALILPVVVKKFFIEGTQQYSADLGRRYHDLLDPVRELETLLAPGAHPDFDAWRQARDALLADVIQRPRRHVKILEAIMTPCGSIGVH